MSFYEEHMLRFCWEYQVCILLALYKDLDEVILWQWVRRIPFYRKRKQIMRVNIEWHELKYLLVTKDRRHFFLIPLACTWCLSLCFCILQKSGIWSKKRRKGNKLKYVAPKSDSVFLMSLFRVFVRLKIPFLPN